MRLTGLGDSTSVVSSMAAAIQRQEGYYPGSVAYTNNNPGNLRTPSSGAWPGQIGVDGNGYAIFGSYADGLAALNSQISTNINRGLTLQQFFAGLPGVYAGYAPAADSNQPNVYAQNVATWSGLPLDVPLNQLGTATSDSWILQTTDTSGTANGTSGISPDVWIVGAAAAVGLLIFISMRG